MFKLKTTIPFLRNSISQSLVAIITLLLAATAHVQSASWAATGSLGTARFGHTETLLPSGKVLVTGGVDSSGFPSSSAELYDPATETWTATSSMGTVRYFHTATLLPSGKVLVAGGWDSNFDSLSSAELYDPATETWAATGSMGTAHILHTATLLPSGKVLVAGDATSSAELYDPATGTWAATGSLGTARDTHTATLLPSGKVLVAGSFGGSPSSSAELYDPVTETWAATGSMGTARYTHTATLLPSGKVLAAAGQDSSGAASSSAELYDPTTPAYAAQVQQPINANGTSVFNVKRGVVPVKFTLTLNGVATCNLPAATIAVYRTGTGGNQPIDEAVYSGPADTGSNFRIDSCQYIYNLSASALGVGTYEVDILINNQIVGSASFKLK